MKPLIYFTIILLVFSSCRSVRKTTVDIGRQRDSVAYSSVTTVDLDTTIIPQDSASLNIVLGFSVDNDTTTGTYSGPFGIQEIIQEQGDNIILNYSIEKTPSGAAKIKVKASTKHKEIVTQSVKVETAKHVESSDMRQVENTKKVKGFSLWNLAWVIPVILIIIFVYLKRKTLIKFFPF